MKLEIENIPYALFVKEGMFGGFDLLTTHTEFTEQATVIGTFADKTRALRAGEKIADAFGAKWSAELDPRKDYSTKGVRS